MPMTAIMISSGLRDDVNILHYLAECLDKSLTWAPVGMALQVEGYRFELEESRIPRSSTP